MRKQASIVAVSAVLSLVAVSGCAGSAGEAEAGSGSEGVEYGAGKEEFQTALEDIDPVELTFQAGSTASGHTAEREIRFAEMLEEWSGGKITIEALHGQPIAPFGQVTDSVADGLIDIGIEVPIYDPSEFPAVNDLSILSASSAPGPYISEMVHIAAAQEVAWNNDELLDDYRDKGVDVLIPVEFEFSNQLICTDSAVSLDEMNGKQVRAGSATDLALVDAIGGSGVSLQSAELYEALQRNTVDCAISSLKVATSQGTLEQAPHIMYTSDVSWGRSPTAWVTGQAVADLPLPARQLVFDSLAMTLGEGIEASAKWSADAVAASDEYGGDFHAIDEEVDERLSEEVGAVQSSAVSVLDREAVSSELEAAVEKWATIAAEEGYEEAGSWEEFAEQMESDPLDIAPFSQRMYEEIYLEHRPS